MIGMNAIFHGAAALVAFLLAWWLLRTRRDREILRDMLASAGRERRGEGRVLRVDEPAAFLARLASALGVPFVDEGVKAEKPTRVTSAPVLELHLLCGIRQILCRVVGEGASAGRDPRGDLTPHPKSIPGSTLGSTPAGAALGVIFEVRSMVPLTEALELRDRLQRALGEALVEIRPAASSGTPDGRSQNGET
jgi:hypothetical protein